MLKAHIIESPDILSAFCQHLATQANTAIQAMQTATVANTRFDASSQTDTTLNLRDANIKSLNDTIAEKKILSQDFALSSPAELEADIESVTERLTLEGITLPVDLLKSPTSPAKRLAILEKGIATLQNSASVTPEQATLLKTLHGELTQAKDKTISHKIEREDTVEQLLNSYRDEKDDLTQRQRTYPAKIIVLEGKILEQKKLIANTSKVKLTLWNTLAELQSSLKKLENSVNEQLPDRIALLEEKIKRVTTQQKEQGTVYVDPNRFRHDVQAHESDPTSKTASESYIPALVNLRHESVSTGNNEGPSTHYARSGSITDTRDGTTNLRDLKAYAKDSSALDKRIAELKVKYTKAMTPGHFTRKKTRLAKAALYKKELNTLKELKKNPQISIASRRDVLQDQMLQLLATQVKHDPEQFSTDSFSSLMGTFSIAQVSMLNPSKNKVKGKNAEFVQNERNQMLDMAEIFAEFDGKTLIFDGKGPFIDNDGVVHLPTKKDDADGKPIQRTLNATFHNISTQGQTKNTGEQAEVNQASLEKIETQLQSYEKKIAALPAGERKNSYNHKISQRRKQFESIKDRLNNKQESNYKIGQDLAKFHQGLGAALGINCFSGKDRTGYAAVKLAGHFIKKQASKVGKLSIFKQKIQSQLMTHASSVSLRVVSATTGFDVFKIQETSLEGLNCFKRLAWAKTAYFAKS